MLVLYAARVHSNKIIIIIIYYSISHDSACLSRQEVVVIMNGSVICLQLFK